MSARRGMTAALLAGAAFAGCTAVSTETQIPVSLQFDSLPALAVVVGDTMRGADLLPARIPVFAFNGAGGIVSDSQIRLVGIDTGSVSAFRIVGGLRLVGTALNPAVRVVAQTASLQSQTQTFAVVRVPTGIGRFAADSLDSLVYDRPDTATRYSDTKVKVFAGDSALNGLQVRFRVVNFTTTLLDSVRIIASSTGRNISSALMTGGTATVRLKAYAKATASGTGVITIEASSRALGADVPNSPLQFRVRLVAFKLP
jgi:hypothetical protein